VAAAESATATLATDRDPVFVGEVFFSFSGVEESAEPEPEAVEADDPDPEAVEWSE
jgi:hypothetical protein